MSEGSGHREYDEGERVAEHSGTNHSIAIGFYIAAIILIFGATLVIAGLLIPNPTTDSSITVNINLWWGAVMVVSGCVILAATLASPRRRAARRLAREGGE